MNDWDIRFCSLHMPYKISSYHNDDRFTVTLTWIKKSAVSLIIPYIHKFLTQTEKMLWRFTMYEWINEKKKKKTKLNKLLLETVADTTANSSSLTVRQKQLALYCVAEFTAAKFFDSHSMWAVAVFNYMAKWSHASVKKDLHKIVLKMNCGFNWPAKNMKIDSFFYSSFFWWPQASEMTQHAN